MFLLLLCGSNWDSTKRTERYTRKMKKLAFDFYQRDNVLQIANELLGKIMVTNWEGRTSSGRIVELEAYAGVTDKASHA